jgi:hypothetical protein
MEDIAECSLHELLEYDATYSLHLGKTWIRDRQVVYAEEWARYGQDTDR